jgi:phytoene dehydrogenase-like protein
MYAARLSVPIFRRQGSGTLINVGSVLSQVGPREDRCMGPDDQWLADTRSRRGWHSTSFAWVSRGWAHGAAMASRVPDAVVVGAGPNGLTAAAVLSLAGLSVTLLEARETIGGGCRTESLTLPGFHHDVCGAIHPMGAVSPIFQRLHLTDHGVQWMSAETPLAHPLDDGRVAILSRRLSDMPATLGGEDGRRWARMVRPFVDRHIQFFAEILRPIRIPRHPWLMARFAALGLQSCARLEQRFADTPARALLAGCAAHSFLPMTAPGSASFGLVLAVAGHAIDWPCARGGSQRIVDALASVARSAGCVIETNAPVRTLSDVPPARAVLFDVTPRQLMAIAADALSSSYRRQLAQYRYGPGVFKIDYALADRIPWRARACATAATVHVGGAASEIARSEAAVNAGAAPDAPFVLIAQQSHMDDSRAPKEHHTGWAYCHVPHGSYVDMTERIERQIERFAPGFRDIVLARHVITPSALQAHNPNMIGGDIGGGANTLRQFLFRPTRRWNPCTTSNPRLFLCSSSTPPGGGVHGMCGYWAARAVLRCVFDQTLPEHLVI